MKLVCAVLHIKEAEQEFEYLSDEYRSRFAGKSDDELMNRLTEDCETPLIGAEIWE